MKQIKNPVLLCFLLLFLQNSIAQQNNGHVTLLKKNGAAKTTQSDYTGHVTLLKKNALLIYVGAGGETPGTETKDGTGVKSLTGITEEIYKPFWVKESFSLGLSLGGQYFFGDLEAKSENLPQPFHVFDETSVSVAGNLKSAPQNQGYRIAVGPQVNFHLGNHVIFSPIFQAGYLSFTQKEFTAVQTTNYNGNIYKYDLLRQSETKTSGMALIPKVRFQYFFNHWVGLWAEASYTIGPTIKTVTSTFTADQDPVQTGFYNIDQLEDGTYDTNLTETKYSSFGVSGGLVFAIGGSTPQRDPRPYSESAVPAATQTSTIKEIGNNELQKQNSNCNPTITYPLNGETFNSKTANTITVTFPESYSGNKNIRVYKVSDIADITVPVPKEKNSEGAINNAAMAMMMEDAVKGKSVVKTNSKKIKDGKYSTVFEKWSLSIGTYMVFAGDDGCNATPVYFSVPSGAVRIVDFDVTCGDTYGHYTYTMHVNNTGDSAIVLNTIALSGISGTVTNVVTTPPPAGINLVPLGTPVSFTGSFDYTGPYPSSVKATVSSHDAANAALTNTDTNIDNIEACTCHDCDNTALSMSGLTVTTGTSTTGQYTVTGNLNVTGLPNVYGVEMQIQSYGFTATPSACTNGISNQEQSGVFIKQGSTINGVPVIAMNETISGLASTNNNITKDIKITGMTPLPASIPLNLNLGFPAPITGLAPGCCTISNNLCLRVIVFYDRNSCKSCSFTYCLPAFTN